MALDDGSPRMPKPVDEPIKEKEDTFDGILEQIRALGNAKNSLYKDSPMNILPTEYWVKQIVIKAMRADMAVEDSKREEELEDTIVYCIRTLIKIRGGSN